MVYIEQFEAELAQKLDGTEDTATIVRWMSEKILENYRNGVTAGLKHATLMSQEKSRRPFLL